VKIGNETLSHSSSIQRSSFHLESKNELLVRRGRSAVIVGRHLEEEGELIVLLIDVGNKERKKVESERGRST